MLLLSLLVVGSFAGQVIAAPNGIDQPPPDRASFLLGLGTLLLAPCAIAVILARGWQRLPRVPTRPIAMPPEMGLALLFAMLLAAPLGAGLVRKLAGLDVPADAGETATAFTVADEARLALGAYAMQALVAGSFLWRVLRSSPGNAPRGRPSRVRAGLIGFAAIALAWPVVNAAGWLASAIHVGFGGEPPEPLAHETLRTLAESRFDGWTVLLLAEVIVAAPVLEEVLYRGLLQESIRRLGLGAWPAIVATSVFFAVMHWGAAPVHAIVALFVLSLAFGWAYERTGRLTASIVMHATFNLGNVVAAMLAGGA